jgi:hypothetical protein
MTLEFRKVDFGTRRAGNYAILRLRVFDADVFMPLLLTDDGWMHLNNGISFDTYPQAVRHCEKVELDLQGTQS